MNLVEVYLKEVHEEKPYIIEEFSDTDFIEVTATWVSWGGEDKKTKVFSTEQWKQIKKQGYYLG